MLPIFFYLFQDGGIFEWTIKLSCQSDEIENKFSEGPTTTFNDEEKKIYSECFEKDFSEIESYLGLGSAPLFLNAINVPYLEMNDQDLIPTDIANGDMYSFLTNEMG